MIDKMRTRLARHEITGPLANIHLVLRSLMPR
jgi:hypothetical protein